MSDPWRARQDPSTGRTKVLIVGLIAIALILGGTWTLLAVTGASSSQNEEGPSPTSVSSTDETGPGTSIPGTTTSIAIDEHAGDEHEFDLTEPSSKAIQDTAVRFVTLWARPELPQDQWLAALQPLTYRTYYPMLATVDPGNVPARRVTGPPSAPNGSQIYATVRVPTDTGPLDVSLTLFDDHWLVSDILPAEK